MKCMSNITVCTISLLISIAALCISYFRCDPITMDWMGVLVGVLSFLVTVLLGWQIYALFDIREIQKEVKRNKAEVNQNMEKKMGESHCALWLYYQSKIEGQQQDKQLLLCACLQSGIAAAFHFFYVWGISDGRIVLFFFNLSRRNHNPNET